MRGPEIGLVSFSAELSAKTLLSSIRLYHLSSMTDKIASETMTRVLELPILGLDETFPDRLYVLHHVPSMRYGCYYHDGVHGLACFSTESGAFRFGELIDLSGMQTEELTFDEARQVAKERPMPVVSLMLLDHLDDPKIHYVR